jgi:glycosyltransferase involved in cell wall biosynthesis
LTIILVPVFKQQRKISYSLKKIKQVVESAFSNYELIVVNDGSTDNTLTIFKKTSPIDPYVSYPTPPNRGKGSAVRQRVLQSRGDIVMPLVGD